MAVLLGIGWLGAFLLVGLLGGAHCIGMCGPLVALYGDRMESVATGTNPGSPAPDGGHLPSRYLLRQHLLFNVGRAASYTVVGAVLGGAGAVLYGAAGLAAVAGPVRAVVGVATGLVVASAGAGYLVYGRAGSHSMPLVGELFTRVHGAITPRLDRLVGGPRVAALGAVHALLPCPLLYPAYVYVFARGSPATGALALGTLGLGTIPSLLVAGTAVGSLSTDSRVWLHRALGVAFLGLAYLPLSMGLRAVGIDLPMAAPPFYQPLG